VDSHIVAEVLGNLLKGKLGGLGEVVPEDWYEARGPDDYDDVVLPSDINEAYWRSLEEKNCR
jgi:hypothetical protein